MNISSQVVILSAELSSLSSKENVRRSELLNDMLTELKMPFKPAEGVYKGMKETSFVVIVGDNSELETIKNFAFKSFNQESVLHQDVNQEAFLMFQDGNVERLGRLEQVSKQEVETLDAYTVMDGKYYATKKRA